jgi:hypothetical protein
MASQHATRFAGESADDRAARDKPLAAARLRTRITGAIGARGSPAGAA